MKADSKLLRHPTLPRPTWPVKLWSLLLNGAIYGLLFWLLAQSRSYSFQFHLLRTRDVGLLGSFWRLVTAVLLSLLLTTTIHELGHLLAGKLVGLRFHLLIIGPLRLSRENGRLSLGWQRGSAFFNGLTSSIPYDNRDLSRRLLIFILGGPLASLVQALLAGWLFFHWRADVSFINNITWAAESAALLAILGAIYFLSALKPGSTYSGQPADGGRLISLLRRGPEAERWCALAALDGADQRGQRPRDWDESLIRQALQGFDHTQDGQNARLLAYQWALDNGRIADANRWLEEAIAIRPTWLPGTQVRLVWEKAYLSARCLHDAVQARRGLDQIRQKLTNQPQHLRAEAAVLLAEGDKDQAKITAQAALASLPAHAPTGVQQAEADWLQDIINQV
ncbi:MAG: hypothetical protein H6667_16850 [Ardenticatenaceae bacterium]|nr:hypothetical protein [Ardenticatenaceae bacterium]MCB9443120.1 hypothetical protein [Ardenticatenaceae bacterium]